MKNSKITEFDQDDWMGFGGAEPFENGEPLICSIWNETAVAIADASGIQVHVYDVPGQPEIGEQHFLLPAPALWSQGIGFAMLTRLMEAVSLAQLEERGFQKI